MLPADAEYDLERGKNNGDAGDLWLEGMRIGPNNDGKTFPNTDSYQLGKIQKSGVTIEILEADGLMTQFEVTMPTKSGNSGAVFSAPRPEADQEPIPAAGGVESNPSTEAQEQFQAGDTEDFRISGKIPQLPWYQEMMDEQQGGSQNNNNEDSPLNSATIHHAPGKDGFEYFDNSVNPDPESSQQTSSAWRTSLRMFIASTSLQCLLALIQ